MNIFTWATYGSVFLVADKGADPQGGPVRLHLVLPHEVGIEPLDGWARRDRLASVGWARTADTTPATSPLKERLHRLGIQAASPPKVQLVGLLTKEVGTLVVQSTLLSHITGTICSCQRVAEQESQKEQKCHLSSATAAASVLTLCGMIMPLFQFNLPNQFYW